MNMKTVLCLGVAVALAGMLWRMESLSDALTAEQEAHRETTAKLESVTTECEAWVAAYFEIKEAAEGQKDTAQACLDREVKARKDAVERAAILSQTKPTPRPQSEQEKVVDDETRGRVADRLNRPL